MIRFKKIAASVAALATALSLSVGTLAVTANEIQKAIDAKPAYTLAEKEFIESYENKGVSDVAKFLLDNDFKLADAKKITELYIDGKNKRMQNESNMLKKAGNSRTYPEFYSTSNLSTKEHRGVVFIHGAVSGNNNINSKLRYNSAWSTIATDTQAKLLHGVESDYSLDFSDYPVSLEGNASFNSYQSTPVALFEFPFTVTTTSASEKIIRDKLKFTTYYPTACCTFYTYVRGDVNHDGLVDTIDLSMIIEINLGHMTEYNLPDDYMLNDNNMDSNVALRINRLAGDMDHDGSVGLSDVTLISDPNNRD